MWQPLYAKIKWILKVEEGGRIGNVGGDGVD